MKKISHLPLRRNYSAGNGDCCIRVWHGEKQCVIQEAHALNARNEARPRIKVSLLHLAGCWLFIYSSSRMESFERRAKQVLSDRIDSVTPAFGGQDCDGCLSHEEGEFDMDSLMKKIRGQWESNYLAGVSRTLKVWTGVPEDSVWHRQGTWTCQPTKKVCRFSVAMCRSPVCRATID